MLEINSRQKILCHLIDEHNVCHVKQGSDAPIRPLAKLLVALYAVYYEPLVLYYGLDASFSGVIVDFQRYVGGYIHQLVHRLFQTVLIQIEYCGMV